MFCKKCGNQVEDREVFCRKCGTKIKFGPASSQSWIEKTPTMLGVFVVLAVGLSLFMGILSSFSLTDILLILGFIAFIYIWFTWMSKLTPSRTVPNSVKEVINFVNTESENKTHSEAPVQSSSEKN